MDVTEEVAKQRGGFGEERYEATEFQRRVRWIYRQLKDETWVNVCADGSLEEVESELLDIVNKELAKERGDVSKLWQASTNDEGEWQKESRLSFDDCDSIVKTHDKLHFSYKTMMYCTADYIA